MPVGLALSGGGARGDFQVGALRFLYDQGVRPEIISGTSVGAVNGGKLAEGENDTDPSQGLRGLEGIWNSLQFNSDMYEFEPWLGEIDERIRGFLTGTRDDPGISPPRTDFTEWGDLGFFVSKVSELSWLTSDGAAILTTLEELMNAKALYNLRPIMEKLQTNLSLDRVAAWAAAGGRLRLAAVCLETGELRYVTENGNVLERDNTTAVLRRAADLAPECQVIADNIEGLRSDRSGLQDDLGTAAPGEKGQIVLEIRALNNQIREQERALDTCIARNPRTPDPLKVRLIDGILASASIPGIFRPVYISDETYVDGGIRDVLPLQVALDMGGDPVWAIQCSKAAVDQKPSFVASSLLEIVARSLTDLAISEIARDDIRSASASGRTIRIVQPTVDLHDATTIDPGLISIGMAYGYMRAADMWDNVPEGDRAWQLADGISLLRREIWRLECLANGQPVPTEPAAGIRPADPSLDPEIQARKEQLRGLVAERRDLGRRLPPDADRWSQTLERHPWVVPTRSAQFVSQSTPATLTPGEMRDVTVVMRNTGTLPWTVSEGYRLGSQNPQDNLTWGVSRVDVPAIVGRFSDVAFGFTITAPDTPGTYNFQWQMLQEGIEWFGDATENIAIRVAPPEPPECAGIRADLNRARSEVSVLRAERASLQGELAAAAPGEKAEIVAEIRRVNAEITRVEQRIAALQQRSSELGCG